MMHGIHNCAESYIHAFKVENRYFYVRVVVIAHVKSSCFDDQSVQILFVCSTG